MATHDDDYLDRDVPLPDAESTPSERAHARTFADIVDKAIAGRPPAAMSADDRALLEVATVIRATRGKAELPADRTRSLVEDALRQAIGGAGTNAAQGVTPIASRRARKWVPWTIAGASTLVAAAAVMLLWLRSGPEPVIVETAAVPSTWTSRPADALIGPIAPAQSGAASARIDTIYADRLDGYRERRWSARGGKR